MFLVSNNIVLGFFFFETAYILKPPRFIQDVQIGEQEN